jgi:hypothetical protein
LPGLGWGLRAREGRPRGRPAFAVVLAVLIRAGVRVLATPVVYVAAAIAGGALRRQQPVMAVHCNLRRRG